MTANGWFQLGLYVAILLLSAKPLGSAMAAVYEGRRTWLDLVFGPLERLTYRICGIDPTVEMRWTTYAAAVLWFSLASVFAVYGLQRLQAVLWLNPESLGPVSADSSFNTAVSLATNTNWQGYGGEVTMSYLTQMMGLTVQNFVSAAAGMAVLIALIRGLTRRSMETIGNFWFDLVRSAYFIILPLSVVLALLLVSQGMLQTFGPYQTVPLLQATSYPEPKVGEDGKPLLGEDGQPITDRIVSVTEQVLPMGPV